MKLTLLIFFLPCLFVSCTQYQYLTVSGINVSKDEKNDLIAENDTLKVQYSFTDYQGRIGITLTNKTDQPIEIDWKKSAVILNDKAISYYNPNAAFAGRVENDTLGYRSRGSIADVTGQIFINDPTQFIPPKSSVHKVPVALLTTPLQNLPVQESVRESVYSMGYEIASYKRMSFPKEKSPVVFRSYLTFRVGSGTNLKEFSIEHHFFISEVWKSGSGPQNFPDDFVNRNDRFYLAP